MSVFPFISGIKLIAITPRLSGQSYAFVKLTGFDLQRIPWFQNRTILKSEGREFPALLIRIKFKLKHCFLNRHLVFDAFTHK